MSIRSNRIVTVGKGDPPIEYQLYGAEKEVMRSKILKWDRDSPLDKRFGIDLLNFEIFIYFFS